MTELRQMADDMADDVIKGVVRVVTPLKHRIEALEKRQPEKGERGKDGESGLSVKGDPGDKGKDGENGKDGASIKGDPGKDGKDADAEAIAVTVLDKVTKALDEIPAAKDGKDADPEFVRSVVRDEVTRAVQALPPPQAGKDGASVDMVTLSGEVMAAAAKAVAALPVPKDGRDFDPEVVHELVERRIEAVLATWPKPTNGIDGQSIKGDSGKDGINGKDANPEFVKQLIESMLPGMVDKGVDELAGRMEKMLETIRTDLRAAVEMQIKALPIPQNGKDADPEVMLRMVKDAVSLVPAPKDGKDGRDAPTLEEIQPLIEKANALLPVPRDGLDGRDAPTLEEFRPMLQGEIAKAVALIPPPEPGRDGRDAVAKNGENGKDGLGFDDLRVEYDGERSFALVFERGTERKEFGFEIPVIIDRGLFESGKTYERGDSVTYGGAMFIAQRRSEAGEKPGDHSEVFRLAVKRGRDAPSRGFGRVEDAGQ